MRIRRTVLVAVAPWLTVLACGGRVDPIGPGGGGGSSSGASSGGSGSGGSSGSSSGGGQCPDPSSVQPGASCSDSGVTCSSNIGVACAGGAGGGSSSGTGGDPSGPIQCTCTDGTWACAFPECPVTCPAPSTVVPGDNCSFQPNVLCPTTIPLTDCSGQPVGYVTCECLNGHWFSDQAVPGCPVDAGPPPCPPPQQVEQGVACASPGVECPGNPQVCDGQIDYDAFQCQGGFWNDVAVTYCAVDAGPSDAGFVDGGMGI